MCHLSTEFCENRLGSFCVILLTNKRTNKHTDTITDEHITSLSEVKKDLYVNYLHLLHAAFYRAIVEKQCSEQSYTSAVPTHPRLFLLLIYIYIHNEKSAQREMQTLRAGCSKTEPKEFAPPQTPFPGARGGQKLISWRWSLPSPTDPVW